MNLNQHSLVYLLILSSLLLLQVFVSSDSSSASSASSDGDSFASTLVPYLDQKIITLTSDLASMTIGNINMLTQNKTIYNPGIFDAETFRCSLAQLLTEPAAAEFSKISQISYNIKDSLGSKEGVLMSMFDLFLFNVLFIVGPISSDVASYTATVTSELNRTMISPYASAISLSTSSNFKFSMFRVIPSDQNQVHAFIQLSKQMKWDLVSALFVGSLYASDAFNYFQSNATDNNIVCACGSCSIPSNVHPDYSNINLNELTNCIRQYKVRAIYLFIAMDDPLAGQFLDQLLKHPVMKYVTPVFASHAASNNSVIANQSKSLKGSLGIRLKIANSSEPRIAKLEQCMNAVKPTNHPYQNFPTFWESYFKCKIKKSDQVTAACPDDISARTSPCVCTGNEVFSRPFGARDALIFDAVMVAVETFSNLVHLCNENQSPCVGGSFYRQNLTSIIRDNVFNGLSGYIKFEGGDRMGSVYEVVEWDSNGQAVVLAEYDSDSAVLGKLNLKAISPPVWRTRGNVIPTSTMTPHIPFYLPHGIASNAIAVLLILISLYAAFFFSSKHNREHRVVRKSGFAFIQTLLFGIIISCCSLIIFSLETSILICQSRYWTFAVGMSIILGAVLSKAYQVYYFYMHYKDDNFKQKDSMNRTVTFSNLWFRFILPIFAINGAILLAWSLMAGGFNSIQLHTLDPAFRYYSCDLSVGRLSLHYLFAFLIVFFNLQILIIITLLFISTRSVSSPYNETKYLSFSVYNTILVMILIMPLSLTGINDRNGWVLRFLLTSFGILMILGFLLFLPILTKAVYIRKLDETYNRRTSKTSSQIPEVGRDSEQRVSQIDPLEYLNIGG